MLAQNERIREMCMLGVLHRYKANGECGDVSIAEIFSSNPSQCISGTIAFLGFAFGLLPI